MTGDAKNLTASTADAVVLSGLGESVCAEGGAEGEIIIRQLLGGPLEAAPTCHVRLQATLAARLGRFLCFRAKQMGVPDSVADMDGWFMGRATRR